VFDLRTLLDLDSPPSEDGSLTLCILEPNDPTAYTFESASWVEAIGAGRQLATLIDQLCKALPPGSVL